MLLCSVIFFWLKISFCWTQFGISWNVYILDSCLLLKQLTLFSPLAWLPEEFASQNDWSVRCPRPWTQQLLNRKHTVEIQCAVKTHSTAVWKHSMKTQCSLWKGNTEWIEPLEEKTGLSCRIIPGALFIITPPPGWEKQSDEKGKINNLHQFNYIYKILILIT